MGRGRTEKDFVGRMRAIGQELTFEVPGRPPASGCFLALQPSLSQKRVTNFASVPPAVLHGCA